MSLRDRFIAWTVASLIGGVIGGWVGQQFFEAPFYFGFFLIFVLLGLSGLFALAAFLENEREQRMKK